MPSPAEDRRKLREAGALLEGHFVLASGRHSPAYVQAARLTERPGALASAMEPVLTEMDLPGEPAAVLTAAMGGVPVGQQVALMEDCRSLFAERDEANQLVLERGFRLEEGEPVLLVEDVVTTGGTLGELEDLVDRAGAEVVGVFTLINRSGSDRWEEHVLNSVYTVSISSYDPAQCPDCREDRPAVRPGSKEVDEVP